MTERDPLTKKDKERIFTSGLGKALFKQDGYIIDFLTGKKRKKMPIKKTKSGKYKFGNSGKEYKSKSGAVKQMKAMFANGYESDKEASKLKKGIKGKEGTKGKSVRKRSQKRR